MNDDSGLHDRDAPTSSPPADDPTAPAPRANPAPGERPSWIREPGPVARPADRTSNASGGARWLIAALSVAVAVLVPVAVVFGVLWNGARSDDDDQRAVRRTAGDFASRFLTIDSEDVDATKERVLELSTGAFRRTYEQGLETGVLQAMLDLGQTRTEATVEEIFVGDVDGRAAHVIVQTFVTAKTVDPSGSPRPDRTTEFFIELDLVKQQDGWLVDAVANLNFGAPGGSGGATVDTPDNPPREDNSDTRDAPGSGADTPS